MRQVSLDARRCAVGALHIAAHVAERENTQRSENIRSRGLPSQQVTLDEVCAHAPVRKEKPRPAGQLVLMYLEHPHICF